MGIWARKRVSLAESIAVQDDFETAYIAMGAPSDMMLVSTNMRFGVNAGEELIIQLPDRELLQSFPGFEPMNRSELPERAVLSVGHEAAFERCFAARSSAFRA